MRVLKHDPQADRGAPSSSASPPNYRIFDGAHSESRFSEVLGRAIASLSEGDLSRLGGGKKQLGTHSVRKGAASYCAGMINGPSTVQVFLRAGWSLGNVQDRYLFAGAGGDQLIRTSVVGPAPSTTHPSPRCLHTSGKTDSIVSSGTRFYRCTGRLPETF